MMMNPILNNCRCARSQCLHPFLWCVMGIGRINTPSSSKSTIKNRLLASKGVDDSEMRKATEKMQDINNAYEEIKKRRNI